MLESIVAVSLVTWRVTSLLQSEAGPFDIFTRLRKLIGIIHDDNIPAAYPDTFFGKLFECLWCLSVWVSFFVTVLVTYGDPSKIWIVWLSGAAGTILIEEWILRSKGE